MIKDSCACGAVFEVSHDNWDAWYTEDLLHRSWVEVHRGCIEPLAGVNVKGLAEILTEIKLRLGELDGGGNDSLSEGLPVQS